MKNKVITDKDRIKFLEGQITELQDIVDSYVHENEQMRSDIDQMISYEEGLEKEYSNLQRLMQENTMLMFLMGLMEKRCDDTCIGTACKLAIRQYQRVLLERMPQLIGLNTTDEDDDEDLAPFKIDDIMQSNDETKDEEREE
ncbi:MAG: hypothetical protein IJ614_03145 [Prevotella sp.]|nr:hypothetical protein [Prevotella sp.]